MNIQFIIKAALSHKNLPCYSVCREYPLGLQQSYYYNLLNINH